MLIVHRALTDAAADAVLEGLAGALAKEYAITDVELLLVDYRLAALLPLPGGPPVTSAGHPAWHSFDHQSEVTVGPVSYLPVTVRGERLGVLRYGPAPDDAEAGGELAEIATMLAHEVQAAGAGTDRYTIAARTRRQMLTSVLERMPAGSRAALIRGLADFATAADQGQAEAARTA